MATLSERIKLEDLARWTDQELMSCRNLADFERRSLVVGENVFQMLLPRIDAEIARRAEQIDDD